MARVGVANFVPARDAPTKQDSYWRLVIERAQRDHTYSSFNDPCPKASFVNLNTTSNEFQRRTWEVAHETRAPAAGKSSFHHNVAKPEAGIVKAHSASHSFERQRTPAGRGPSPAAAAGRGMLQSSSAPNLPMLPLEGHLSRDKRALDVLQHARPGSGRSTYTTSTQSRHSRHAY